MNDSKTIGTRQRERERLQAAHHELALKKHFGGLSKVESRQLAMLRWRLDVLEFAMNEDHTKRERMRKELGAVL